MHALLQESAARHSEHVSVHKRAHVHFGAHIQLAMSSTGQKNRANGKL